VDQKKSSQAVLMNRCTDVVNRAQTNKKDFFLKRHSVSEPIAGKNPFQLVQVLQFLVLPVCAGDRTRE